MTRLPIILSVLLILYEYIIAKSCIFSDKVFHYNYIKKNINSDKHILLQNECQETFNN